MAIHKEDSLPAVSAAWGQRLPTAVPHVPVPPAADPASNAAAAGMATWPVLHEALTVERQAVAAQLLGATDQTDAVLDAADETNAAVVISLA